MKKFRQDECALVLGQRVRRLQAELEVPVARPSFGERLELHQQRRHQVERQLHLRKLAQQRDHAVVVLQPVQPHPRQDVLARCEVFVVRLVHVPEDGDVSHVVSSLKTPNVEDSRPLCAARADGSVRPLAAAARRSRSRFRRSCSTAKRSSPKAPHGTSSSACSRRSCRRRWASPSRWRCSSASSSRSAASRATARSSRWRHAASASAACCVRCCSSALVATAATTYVMIVALPAANQAFREITFKLLMTRGETKIKPRVFYTDFPNLVIYVREVTPGVGWTDVMVTESSTPTQPKTYLAQEGTPAARRVEAHRADGADSTARITPSTSTIPKNTSRARSSRRCS